MPWLLLDTALPRAVVAVVDGVDGAGAVVAERFLPDTRRHAEALSGAVDDVLTDAGITARQLDGVAAGAGPGSFIGVRTGLSFALGLGRAVGCPVVGVDGALALAASVDTGDGEVVVVVDAKRGELYLTRCLRAGDVITAVQGPVAIAPAAVVVDGAVAVVGAVDQLPAGGTTTRHALAGPTGQGLAVALRHADRTAPPHPVYVRDADARLPSVDPAGRRQAVLAALDAHDATQEARRHDP